MRIRYGILASALLALAWSPAVAASPFLVDDSYHSLAVSANFKVVKR